MNKAPSAFNPGGEALVIPFIRGSGGGGKGGGGGGSTEDPTSLQSNQIAAFVDLLCEGPIYGLAGAGFTSVYLNNTPLQNPDGSFNFQGCTLNYNLGYPSQAPLPGASNAEQVFELNQQVLFGIPYTIELTPTGVDAVVLTIGVGALIATDTTTGDIHGSTMQFHVDIKANNGAWATAFSDTISGKTNSAYSRDYRLELPQAQGPWQVRMVRDTPDSTSTAVVNASYFVAYTEITELNLSYPYSVIFGWSISAQQFGSSIPNRAYLIKGMLIQIPSNYDPGTRTYSGAYWDGTFKTAWSDNPAWVMYDILTNSRYGLGKRIDASVIDKFSLYAIGQYCDEYVPDGFGSYEPRFRFNGLLSQAGDAYSVLQSIASTMRGMIYWSAGAVTFTQDSPKTFKKVFAPANVINGQFDYQSTALKDRHSVTRVIWNDPDNYYQQSVEVVEHQQAMQRFGWRSVDIQAIGTTSRGQAHRIGKWMLDTEFSEGETVTFTCSLQEADLMPGDLIYISDPSVAGGRFGGRTISNVGTAVVLDAPVTLYGGDSIMIVSTDGASIWQANVSSTDGLNPTVNLSLSVPFTTPVQPGATFLMSSPTVAPRTFRVVSNTETAVNTWQVAALEYDGTKYLRIEDNINLPQPSTSILPSGPVKAPTNVLVTESLFQMNGSIISRLTVSWTPSTDARTSGYDVYAMSPGGNMQWMGRSTVSSFDIDTAQLGQWEFNVYSSSLLGDSPTPAIGYKTVLGKNAPPSDVTGLSFTFDPTIGIVLTWKGIPDIDLALYEVRKVDPSIDDWDFAAVLGQVKGSSFTVPPGNGAGKYMVKAISIMGNYSLNPGEAQVNVPMADAPVMTGTFIGDQCVFTWNVPNSAFAIDYYEVRLDPNFGNDDPTLLIGTVKGNTISTKANWGGARDFYIAANDIAGDYGNVGNVTVTIVVPSQPTITAQVIDNNVLLRWSASIGTLPVDHYEVRKGSVWASAPAVGIISGTFDTLFETAAGTYTYWIAGVDTAGNYGIPGSVTATVSQPPDYVLLYNYNSTFGGSLTNSFIGEDGGLLLPVDAVSTFEQHFTNNRVVSTSALSFGQWIPTNGTVSLNETDAESGNTTAATLTSVAAGATALAFSVPAAPGDYTFSVKVRRRAGTGTGTVSLLMRDSETSLVDYGTPVAVTTSEDWQRVNITGTVPSGETAFVVELSTAGNALGDILDIDAPQVSTGDTPLAYWDTPNDQMNAGFPIFIEPGMTEAVYSETLDYGAELPSTKFTVTPTVTVLDGNPTLDCDIQVSLDGVTWIDFPDTTVTFVSNFRYAKVTLTVTGDGGDLLEFNGLNIRFDVKQKNDGGLVQCSASDVGGTPVTFGIQFIDVQSITTTGQGTIAAFAIYDFVDIPYPTGFTVYLFDKDGNRITGNASWAARGV
jgi:predicted phage tail protein